MDREGFALKILQISDLHIEPHRNLLAPMVDSINNEDVDLVVVTGDTVHFDDNELYKVASNTLNKIRHRTVVIPGDYDNGDLFSGYFGVSRLKSLDLNGYCIEFLDTSFMKHRFAVGWDDVLKKEDPEQHEWLVDRLKTNDKYHIVFSHHPYAIEPRENEVCLSNNLRAVYSGHLHNPIRLYHKYKKPKSQFPNAFSCVSLKFHGNACYMLILIKPNHEIVNVPRIIKAKRTAW